MMAYSRGGLTCKNEFLGGGLIRGGLFGGGSLWKDLLYASLCVFFVSSNVAKFWTSRLCRDVNNQMKNLKTVNFAGSNSIVVSVFFEGDKFLLLLSGNSLVFGWRLCLLWWMIKRLFLLQKVLLLLPLWNSFHVRLPCGALLKPCCRGRKDRFSKQMFCNLREHGGRTLFSWFGWTFRDMFWLVANNIAASNGFLLVNATHFNVCICFLELF